MKYSATIRHRLSWGLALLWLMAATVASVGQEKKDLSEASLEDLMNIRVTSVSRTERMLSQTPSAVFVITAEDIRQSGATNIAEALRIVPGVNVARINANTWAISVRGFNGRFADELLVMVDGRPVYTPTFGGVFWDQLDLPLEDIDRIEVIRGPGGSVWGANAVNGVISIMTKKAAQTHGGMVVASGGTLDQGLGTAQYGGRLGKNTDYRVYIKYFNQGYMPGFTLPSGADAWHVLRGGFRTDSSLSTKDTLTVQGDAYGGNEGVPTSILSSVTSPAPQNADTQVDLSGGFLQSIWNHVYSDRSATTLQMSFTRYKRLDALGEDRNIFNVDFQHHFAWGARQDTVWGASYRYTESDSRSSLLFSLNPASLDTHEASAFFQDEIALLPERLYLTVGAKLEQNHYTGLNLMPSARVVWSPSRVHTIWAAVSHAVRTPSAVDTSARINFGGFPGPGGTPALAALVGNPHFGDEGLNAYEMGYRTTVLDHLSLDFAAYYNTYSSEQTTEPAAPFFEATPPPPHLVFPSTFQNLMHGESHGFEVAANWRINDRWTLSPGYAFEQIHMHTSSTSQDTQSAFGNENNSPTHSAQLRSTLSLRKGLIWDASAYFVDSLAAGGVPSYTRVDTGLRWQWTEALSLSLVGQNLLRDRHLEFIDDTGSARSTLIKRSAYVKVAWNF
jgi:iron complex outermembrane receptor protein